MSTIEEKFKLPKRFIFDQSNVWEEYATLATTYSCLDVATGFPDCFPSKYVSKTLEQIAKQDSLLHQYTRDYGHPRLVNVLSNLYSKLSGREINPETEILTTVGAYEALFCTTMGHVDEGDEVIIIEPFFDCYDPMVRVAGGIPRFIPLRLENFSGDLSTSGDWILNKREFESLFTSKTKMIILNNPHSPSGKVFKREELEFIADLCKKWNVLCVCDEVFEWMVYKPNEHTRMATLPGMWERTITIGSAGKTFGATGWKLGWAYGSSDLLFNLQMVHQNSVYTGNTPMQEVVAQCLEQELQKLDEGNCYLNLLSAELEEKRNYMVKFLLEAGMKPTVPNGGCFIMADWSSLEPLLDLSSEKEKWRDCRFTKFMIKNLGLQSMPMSAFYSEDHKIYGENFARFSFFKKNETLSEAAGRLMQWRRTLKK